MIRTHVYLDDHQPAILKVIAKTQKKSEAEIHREALEIGLREMRKNQTGNAKGFLELAKLGERLKVKAPADLSARIDDYLYGDAE